MDKVLCCLNLTFRLLRWWCDLLWCKHYNNRLFSNCAGTKEQKRCWEDEFAISFETTKNAILSSQTWLCCSVLAWLESGLLHEKGFKTFIITRLPLASLSSSSQDLTFFVIIFSFFSLYFFIFYFGTIVFFRQLDLGSADKGPLPGARLYSSKVIAL